MSTDNTAYSLGVLRKVRELIAEAPQWTQFASARDKDLVPVAYDDPAAVCWSMKGAIDKCGEPGTEPHRNLIDLIEAMAPAPLHSIELFNDQADDHEDVLGLVDRVIARLEAWS